MKVIRRALGRLGWLGRPVNRVPVVRDVQRAKLLNGMLTTQARQSWYAIRNATQSEAEILIYDEIGWFGVEASQFVDELKTITAKTIKVRINSPGGDVFDGVAIYNALKNNPATINVHVDGLAASAASFIAQAGDSIIMETGSMMMIHDAAGFAFGNAATMREMATLLDGVSNTIASIYTERAGGTDAAWRTVMEETRWYSAQEAVDAGLADSVAPARDRAKPDDADDAPGGEGGAQDRVDPRDQAFGDAAFDRLMSRTWTRDEVAALATVPRPGSKLVVEPADQPANDPANSDEAWSAMLSSCWASGTASASTDDQLLAALREHT